MVHSAYDSLELLSNCPSKIDAIQSHDSSIFLACTDGSLRIYAPSSSSSTTTATSTSSSSPTSDRHVHSPPQQLLKEPYVLQRTVTGFYKKTMVAMEVSESKELLISLSESIAFHKLPSLETVAVITKAKGANAFAWDDKRGFLCFARQKRVCIFRHDGDKTASDQLILFDFDNSGVYVPY